MTAATRDISIVQCASLGKRQGRLGPFEGGLRHQGCQGVNWRKVMRSGGAQPALWGGKAPGGQGLAVEVVGVIGSLLEKNAQRLDFGRLNALARFSPFDIAGDPAEFLAEVVGFSTLKIRGL